MRILLSNDEDIYAPGIQQLAAALRQLATVQIVMPNRGRRGTPNSLTMDLLLQTGKIPNVNVPNLPLESLKGFKVPRCRLISPPMPRCPC